MFSQREYVPHRYAYFPYESPNCPSYYELRYRECQDSMLNSEDQRHSQFLNFAGPNYSVFVPGKRLANFVDPGVYKNPGPPLTADAARRSRMNAPQGSLVNLLENPLIQQIGALPALPPIQAPPQAPPSSTLQG